MKQVLVIAIVFLSSHLWVGGAVASPRLGTKQGSGKASTAMTGDVDSIEAAYYSLTDLTAKFVQTTKVALIDRTVTRKGTFRFKKGGKLRIEYEGRDAKVYVSDGTTLWIFVPGDESSLQTFAVNDETVPKEALSFLSGFGRLKKEFRVSESDAFHEAREGMKALRLVPRSRARHYDSLDALFGPDNLLAELIISNTSGNVSHYKFTDIRTNLNLADDFFTLSSGKATPETLPR